MTIAAGSQALASDVNNALDALETVLTDEQVTDQLQNSNDTERTTTSESYVKLKEIKLNASLAAARIKFDLRKYPSGPGYVYGKIYKNGSPIGTEQTATSTLYTTLSEDFASLNGVADDLIQLYGYRGAGTCYVRNFRLYYSKFVDKLGTDYPLLNESLIEMDGFTVSTTNQDP